METRNNLNKDQDAKLEKDAVDPASESQHNQPLTTRDDKRTHNIDANMSISQMREAAESNKSGKLEDQPADQDNGKEDDAMNYKSDREHGAYNSKNI